MLELRSVSKSYPGAGQVLREVSLRVEPGQALCLAGGNAEGKTTLLEIAAGLRRPDSGEVLRPAETALVPQRPAVLGELTAADNLALWYAAAGQRERPFSPGSPEEKLGLSPFARRRAEECSAAFPSRRPSVPSPARCCSTSRLRRSTPGAARWCTPSWRISYRRAAPSCSPPTSRSRSPRWPARLSGCAAAHSRDPFHSPHRRGQNGQVRFSSCC